jgi:ribosome-interacting GTPase 1
MNKDFSKGKIYKIEPIVEHDIGDIYIGSTIKHYLSDRMGNHRQEYKTFKENGKHTATSRVLFEKYGIDNCKIILLETVNVKTLYELKAREAFYIQTLPCVNKNVPNRTPQEWYEINKERQQELKREYNEKHKEHRHQKQKESYYKNHEERLATIRLYNNTNKDKIKENRLKPCECACGSTYSLCNKTRHEKTKKHLTFITQQVKINI